MRYIAFCMSIMLCMTPPCSAEADKDTLSDESHTPADESFRARHGQGAYADASFFIAEVLKGELRAQENAAIQAYFRQSPEVAAWALEELINSYARIGLIMRDIQAGWEQEAKGRRMFAHARLFKLYTSMNDDQQAQRHLAESVRLGEGKSVDEIMKLVEHLDKVQSE